MRSEEIAEQFLKENDWVRSEDGRYLYMSYNGSHTFDAIPILGDVIEYASQFREPSTQGGEEKIFMEPESTYSLMTSSDPKKVEKGKVLRVQELAFQLVKKNKRIQVLEEALREAKQHVIPSYCELREKIDQALNPKD